LIGLTSLAGCSQSHVEQYVTGMQKALPTISEWENSISNYNDLLIKKIDGNINVKSYGDLLTICIDQAIPGGNQGPCITQKDYAKPALEIDNLSKIVMNKGLLAKSELVALTPPAAFTVAQNQVIACIDQENQIMSGVIDILEKQTFDPMPAADVCTLKDSALQQIIKFVDDNK
jgi:hypothetical protein